MDRLDVEVHDGELQAEIRMVGDLMVAANESDGPLCREAIDAVLAVRPGRSHATGPAQPPGPPPQAKATTLQQPRARPA